MNHKWKKGKRTTIIVDKDYTKKYNVVEKVGDEVEAIIYKCENCGDIKYDTSWDNDMWIFTYYQDKNKVKRKTAGQCVPKKTETKEDLKKEIRKLKKELKEARQDLAIFESSQGVASETKEN